MAHHREISFAERALLLKANTHPHSHTNTSLFDMLQYQPLLHHAAVGASMPDLQTNPLVQDVLACYNVKLEEGLSSSQAD